ncbi:MAG TPA: ankyrin repeat domain-containing protein [Vicinamibacterales bacterium]|jgi:ankyrin repeat protein|nr:ankyrin repeat domain-containing protein [Vicinamibacterales bacterium]
MSTEEKRFQRIDAAFAAGDLTALRAAIDDPPDFPNNVMPLGVGPILTYAIYWSPLRFIEELLAIGADPNRHDNDGFPPLIAALSKTHPHPGSRARDDVLEVMARLLDAGADPDQRGINDWTALMMAVVETNVEAVRLLLARGANPSLRTRIDDYETALELTRAGGVRKPEEKAALAQIVALLEGSV